MRFGFYLPTHGATSKPSALKEIARRGDELGFHSMVAGDHIIRPTEVRSTYPYSVSGQLPWGSGGDHLEQLTELVFLAAVTERIRIVPSVMIVPYRNPLVAAKMLATMDYLSEGRLTVGVGVGWMEEEFVALDTPPFNRRGAVTNEYIRAFKELWTSDSPTFEGEFYRFSNIELSPKPVQKPHPPIWVGGQSRAAIRRAAQLGDAWHPVGAVPATPLEPEGLIGNVATLRELTERAGRAPEAVEVVMKVPLYDAASGDGGPRRRFSGRPEDIAEDIRTYADIGVGELIFDVRSEELSQTLERLAWLAEEVATLV